MKNGLLAKDILSILADESSRQIMKLLDGHELSAKDISATLDMPISSTYKKIKKLEQLKLVKVTKVIRTFEGMDESFYTLAIRQIIVTYKNNDFSFDIQQRVLDEKIARLWQKFKG